MSLSKELKRDHGVTPTQIARLLDDEVSVQTMDGWRKNKPALLRAVAKYTAQTLAEEKARESVKCGGCGWRGLHGELEELYHFGLKRWVGLCPGCHTRVTETPEEDS